MYHFKCKKGLKLFIKPTDLVLDVGKIINIKHKEI